MIYKIIYKMLYKMIYKMLYKMIYKMLYKMPANKPKKVKLTMRNRKIRKLCTIVKGVKTKKGVKQGPVDFVVIPNRL